MLRSAVPFHAVGVIESLWERRWAAPLAAAITAVAFALRVVGLDAESLWFDTAHSGVVALNPTVGQVVQGAAADFQAPAYFVLQHFWLALSQQDFWLGFPSVVAGTLIIPLSFAFGRRLFAANAGLAAAMVSALTTYQVYYSRYPRAYILLAFLGLLAAYWLHRALFAMPAFRPDDEHAVLERKAAAKAWRVLPWVAHGLTVAVALYTQPYAFFIVAAMWGAAGLHALLLRRDNLVPLIATAVLVGLAYLPWLSVTAGQMTGVKAGADAWIEPVSRDSLKLLWDWLWFKTRGEYNLPLDLLLRGGRYLLTAVMLAFVLAAWRRFSLLYLLALTAGPVVLAFGFSALVVSLWDTRYLVSMSPFFALWLGAAIAWLPGGLRGLAVRLHRPMLARAAGWALPAGLLLVLAMAPAPLWSLYRDPAQRSADVRAAMREAHARYQPGDTILHTGYQTYLPALWYDHQDPTRGDGPHPAPCTWVSLPPAWCAGSPYREVYVNPDLTPFAEGVRGVGHAWLVVQYNHNKPGDAEAQVAHARQLAAGRFTVAPVYQVSGAWLLELSPSVP